eukprot:Lankesteria_metandrocarpae@DN5435_c0_g2_i1.p1
MAKNVSFAWNNEQDTAFSQLCDIICEHVMLSAPKGTGPFAIIADASDRGLGAALMQVQCGELVLLQFAAKRLTIAERKWDVREREAFAVKWSVKRFEDYVKCGQIYVISDHESLRWMWSAKSGKVQRWALFLQPFDITYCYISGNANVVADWLSRSVGENDEPEHDQEIDMMATPVACVVESKATEQHEDSWHPFVPHFEHFKSAYEDIPTHEARLLFTAPDGMKYGIRSRRLYIPMPLRETILYWFHASRYGGHGGVNRTLRRMQRWVWWPNIAKDVQKYVKACLICQSHGAPPKARYIRPALERPMPLQLISVDHVGPRKWFNREVHYIVIIDHCTRFMVAASCGMTALESIEMLRTRWCSVFQAPNVVLTDRGPAFRGKFQQYVREELVAFHLYTSAYYPQGNGINEAAHKNLNKALQAAEVSGTDVTFAMALQDAVAVHNSCPHLAINASPFFAMFGFEPILPGWQRFRNQDDGVMKNRRLQNWRQARMLRASVELDGTRLKHPIDISIGDWVVFHRTQQEQSAIMGSTCGDNYSKSWSLPKSLEKLNMKMLELRVPVSLVPLPLRS